MLRWVPVVALGGCNLALNAVKPSVLDTGADSTPTDPEATDLILSEIVEGPGDRKFVEIYNGTGKRVPVSYTHLTLPTICSV